MNLLPVTLLVTLLASLNSCVVGPKYTAPELDTPDSFSSSSFTKSSVSHWVQLYKNPQLSKLVEKARSQNHNLAALYQQTLQSRAIINSARSNRLPGASIDTSYTRSKASEEVERQSTQSKNSYKASLGLSWELDLFGRVQNLIDAAKADSRAADAAYEDMLLITQTDIAITYYRIAAVEREMNAVKRSIQTRKESLNIVKARFKSGVDSELESARSEALLADSQADLYALKRQRDTYEHALAVLTGEAASAFHISISPIKGSPTKAPVGIPSDLLRNRPDLRKAEAKLMAANSRVGVNAANFYPSIRLAGDVGSSATSTTNWFKSVADFYSVGPQISLPIFQGTRLRSELTRSEYAYAESLELYKQAVTEAFAEVEDALSGWRHLSSQRAARDRATTASVKAQEISNKQYSSGIIDFISALDAERTALDSERRLAQVIGDEYENSILLIRAIGGSWK